MCNSCFSPHGVGNSASVTTDKGIRSQVCCFLVFWGNDDVMVSNMASSAGYLVFKFSSHH